MNFTDKDGLESATSETIPKTQSLIQIISGLKKSEQVIVNGASYLTDNAKVSLVTEQGR